MKTKPTPEAKQTRRRGDGSIIRRTGSQFLWIQYFHNGRRIRESAGTADEKVALKMLRKKTGGALNGIVQDSRGLKYEHLRDAYLAESETNNLKSLRRDKNKKVYSEAVRRLDDFFSGVRAVDVNADMIRDYKLDQKKRGLSNGSVNRSLASMRRMFGLAQEEEKLHSAPFFKMLPESKPRQGILAEEKYPALLAALPVYVRPVVAVAHATGMRLSEILNLRWPDVDFLENTITIRDSKNGERRVIPASPELALTLTEQFKRRDPACPFVCSKVDRLGRSQRVKNFRKAWRAACCRISMGSMETVPGEFDAPRPDRKRAVAKPKTKYVGLLFHDLRRGFVTDCENSGVPRHEAMQMSGHRSEAVYLRYSIGNLDSRRAALAIIGTYRKARSQRMVTEACTVEAIPEPRRQ